MLQSAAEGWCVTIFTRWVPESIQGQKEEMRDSVEEQVRHVAAMSAKLGGHTPRRKALPS